MKLNHVRRGSGEPLLLIHSLGGTLSQWNPVMELLAAHRDVVAIDMPGFGRSPLLPNEVEPTARNLASAVIEFSESLGLRSRPGVAGISLGSWVAIECGRLGGASAVGPILLGLSKPCAALQNEVTVEDIVNMTAYVVLKAQQNRAHEALRA